MKNRNKFFKSLEQDLTYIIALLMAIMIDYYITPNYLQSDIWRIDSFFLVVQGTVFIFECLLYMKNRNNADMQEEIDVIDEELNDYYETGKGKILFLIKSLITKGFTLIIILRLILHLLGFQNI